jgi:IclR family KDG regulon transcriptional repressor
MQEPDLDDRAAPPRAPLRVMQILAELARDRSGASLGRLSERLELPKSSVFSLLRSLEAGNYVVSEDGHHRLGQGAFDLAAAIYQQEGLAGRLHPLMQWLQEQTGETTMLAVPAADWSHLVFADVIEAQSSLRFTAHVGARRPLYSTSVGLALLANAPVEQQERYLRTTEFVRLTPDTITTAAGLRQAIQRIRREGCAINKGSVEGVTAIAAPVFGPQGELTASVSVAGPTSRMEERSKAIVALVLEAARRMSHMLGCTGADPESAGENAAMAMMRS